jgi:hypothetical protein
MADDAGRSGKETLDGPTAPGGQDGSADLSPADLQERVRHLETELRRLTAALEDVVALALTTADFKQRSIMMHRRAVAALSGLDAGPASQTRGG